MRSVRKQSKNVTAHRPPTQKSTELGKILSPKARGFKKLNSHFLPISKYLRQVWKIFVRWLPSSQSALSSYPLSPLYLAPFLPFKWATVVFVFLFQIWVNTKLSAILVKICNIFRWLTPKRMRQMSTETLPSPRPSSSPGSPLSTASGIKSRL